ncbi:hypothetical protein LYZ82_24115 [Xanthomonas hortorum pv. hederae]|nr:hypothetical protein [Xanthomonas hortorum pv. hederae]
MIKLFLFDLDQTLVDTYDMKEIREVIRPGFPRHLKAMENGRFGGVYEQQAVYG